MNITQSSPQHGPVYFSFEGTNLVELRKRLEEATSQGSVGDDSEPIDDAEEVIDDVSESDDAGEGSVMEDA